MNRISLVSALVLGSSFLFAPMVKADQSLNLDFNGVAQSNCQFTNIKSGQIVALGNDIGTIASSSAAGANVSLGNIAGVAPVAASFTAYCNSETALFVDTPVGNSANPSFNAVSSKSVLQVTALRDSAGNEGTIPTRNSVEAYTENPANPARSDGFLPFAAQNSGDFNIDMNAQSNNGIPVGIYKYTVKVTAVPQ